MAIEVGNIFEGRVTGVKPFGAFVALPEGRVGMVHISEVSNEYVQDIATVLHDGDTVKVQVINVAPDGKIALSIKRLLPPAPRAPREGRGPRPNSNGPREGGFRRNGPGGRPQGGRGPARDAAPRVWQPKAPAKSDNLSFEDMRARARRRWQTSTTRPTTAGAAAMLPGDAAAAAEPSAQDEEALGLPPAGRACFLVRHAAPDRKGNQNACKI